MVPQTIWEDKDTGQKRDCRGSVAEMSPVSGSCVSENAGG